MARYRCITAGELVDRLVYDDEYHNTTPRELELKKYHDALEVSERPLVELLNEAGYPIKSIWDFTREGELDPILTHILVEQLSGPYMHAIKEGIARSLTFKGAGEDVYQALVAEYRKNINVTDSKQGMYKSALDNAISVVAEPRHFDEVAELILDKRHGCARGLMASSITRLDGKRGLDVLVKCLTDDEVAGWALRGLLRLRSPEAVLQITIQRTRIRNIMLHSKSEEARKRAKRLLIKHDLCDQLHADLEY